MVRCEVNDRKVGPVNRSRRELLRQITGMGICLPFAKSGFASYLLAAPEQHTRPAPPPAKTFLSPDDDQFLDELERITVCYFWEQANPITGLVKDRCNARKASTDNAVVASIAATGFGLSALCIGEKRGFISLSEARTRVLNTLRFLWKTLPHHRGFFYHFANVNTGERLWDSEISSVDTAILLCGIPSHPLKVEAWDAWKRNIFEYDGLRYIGSFAPLFVHQYSQAFFDFRGKRDRYADYFQNSAIATDVHRRFCLELAKQFPDYSDDLWGITASDSDRGYVVWGGPPAMGPIDGTIVPSAAGGSLPFLPQPVMRVLRNIRNRYPPAWSTYGFVNAFNPLKGWYDSDVVAIDTGITLLMAENARTGFVWNTFMKNREAIQGMQRAGFKTYQPPDKA